MRRPLLHRLFRSAGVIVALAAWPMLSGCFAMSAVPPAEGLMQVERPDGHDATRFDTAASAEAESDWGQSANFILLHPTINGCDVGWFIFDTGASGCTITADAAARAGLSAIGTTKIQGTTSTTVYGCDSLTVGPLTLTGLRMTGLNMGRSSGAFGRSVVGILGRNVCSSAIVELDGPGRAVRLHDPEGDSESGALASVPVEMHMNLPHVRGAYLGVGDGLFLIDTGADATVHFFASALERHGLAQAKGVTMTGGKLQSTFGSVARIDTGSVDSFRIGGQQFGPLAATFARPGDAPSKTLPDADGLIGVGLMRMCTVFLDEPHGRVSFVLPERRTK